MLFFTIRMDIFMNDMNVRYAHKSNQFWRLMYESGLIPTPLGPEDDSRLVEYGIGLTCLVPRASTSTSEISKAEWRSGYAELLKKIAQYRPFCVAFNGKSVFEVATGRKVSLASSFSHLTAPIYFLNCELLCKNDCHVCHMPYNVYHY